MKPPPTPPNNIKPEQLNPKKNPRYYARLYQFMKDREGRRRITTMHCTLFKGTGKDGQLFMGYYDNEGCFSGARLSRILTDGEPFTVYCFGTNVVFKEVKNFWPKYLNGGMCFVNPKHTGLRQQLRMTHTGKKRVCDLCGQVQKFHKKTVIKREEITWWENI